jgi:hypothetical protein
MLAPAFDAGVTPEAIDTVASLGPLGVWSLLLWQLARVVGSVQEYVKAQTDHLAEEARHWAAEDAHRKAEVDRWKDAARHESRMLMLSERTSERRTRRIPD